MLQFMVWNEKCEVLQQVMAGNFLADFLRCIGPKRQPNCRRPTINRWWTVVSATWKYDDPRLNMSHELAARVWHLQPREVLFPCRTNYRVSYVLSSDQLQESWIICKLKGKIHCILYIFFCHVGETRVSGEIVCHLQMHAVVWCMLITVN